MATFEAPVLNRIRRWLGHTEATPDAELVERFVAARDESAFAALVDRHGPMVLGVARRVTGDHHAAEDVFQAAFLTLARRAGGIRRPGAVAAWLHQTAHRLSLTTARARARRERAEQSAPPLTRADPLDDLSARELLAVLDDELGKLPVRVQQVLVLCCLEGRTSEEAGALLGCSMEAVRGRLERGRRRLRERLARRGLTFAVAAGTPLLVIPPPALAGALRESALAAAFDRMEAAPAVISLAEEGLRSSSRWRWGIVTPVLIAFTGIGFTVALASLRQTDPAPPRVDAPPIGAPTEEVSLPTGAAARLAWDPLRIGHAQAALTPDGKNVVAVAGGAIVYTYDAKTGKLLERRPLGDRRELHPESWEPLLSADGSAAAVEDGYGSYHCSVWNLVTGERVLQQPVNSRVRSLSADGRSLALIVYAEAKKEWAIRVHDMNRGELRDAAYTGDKTVSHLWLTPDGKRVIARAQEGEGTLFCHDVATGKELWTVAAASGVASCTFPPDGRTVFIADSFAKQRFRVLHTDTGKPVEGLYLPKYTMFNTPAAAGDRLLLVPLRSGEVAVWDYRAGKELHRLKATAKSFITVYVFPAADGKTVLTDGDGLRRWNLETGEQIFGPAGDPPHYGSVHALAFLSNGRLASVAAGGEMRQWNLATGRPVGAVCHAGGTELWLTREGPRTLKLDYPKALLNVVDPAGNTVGKFAITDDPKGFGSTARSWEHRLLGDGRTALTCFHQADGQKSKARVTATDYIAGTKKSQVDITLPFPFECDAEFSPCGRWVSVSAQVFAVSSGKSLWTPSPGDGWNLHFQTRMKFSPDGRLICARVTPATTTKKENDEDGQHDVWEVASGTRIARIAANRVGRVAIGPDNRTFAYLTGFGVHLFDLVSGKPLAEYEDPGVNCSNFMWGEASTLVFSPDGRSVATAHHDGSIMVWKVPQSPAAKLTAAERNAAWADLAGNVEPVKARRAVDRLAGDPEGGIAALAENFKAPAAPAEADVPALIRALDSTEFAERERATRRLRDAGPRIAPALRDAARTASAEAKERIDKLLASVDPTPQLPLTGETLRGVRAIEVLERIGTPAARKQLHAWMEQTADLYLGGEASRALDRLQLNDANRDYGSK